MTLAEMRKEGYALSEHQWLSVSAFAYQRAFDPNKFQRILFLETIAGVPGMVAATLRHLRSLRLMVS